MSREGASPAVKKAMNLLLYKDRTEKELQKRLEECDFAPEEISEAMEYVRSFGYLNDRKYAENYILTYRMKKSRSMIVHELRERGIEEIHIEAAEELFPEDESDPAFELLKKKAGEPHRLEDKELRRCVGYLGRRGYRSGDIWKAVHRYNQSGD